MGVCTALTVYILLLHPSQYRVRSTPPFPPCDSLDFMSVEASISKEFKSKRRGAFRALQPSKKRKTQQSDIQPVAANRNLERDFFQKVNGFFQKVNAFF